MRMGRSTRFYFYPSNTAQQYNQMNVLAAIKIYTLSGKVVRSLKMPETVRYGMEGIRSVISGTRYLSLPGNSYFTCDSENGKKQGQKLIIHPPR